MRAALAAAVVSVAMAASIPSPVLSQQTPRFEPKQTAACLKKARRAEDRLACIGASADACRLRMTSPGLSDIALCLSLETDYWSKRMRSAREAMQDKAALLDATFDKAVNTDAPPFRLTEDLAAQQAAWEDFRERTCTVEAMLRRGTPYRSTAAASCIMKLTGQQALFLEKAVKYR